MREIRLPYWNECLIDLIGTEHKIDNVDHCGLNGRNLHPRDSDIGSMVRIIGIDSIWKSEDPFCEELKYKILYGEQDFQQYDDFVVFLCLSEHEYLLQLSSYELDIDLKKLTQRKINEP